MRLRACHYATARPVEIECTGATISSIGAATAGPADREASWVAPAWFDLQINGCGGYSFNSPNLTLEHIRHVVNVCRRHGIGALCPTLITNDFDALTHGFRTLRRACEQDAELDHAMPCFHLEGPYISPEDGPRGAHPRQHVRPPDWEEFQRWQEAAGGRIRLVTLAPETPGALPFIERLVHSGVVVALGHTAAKGSVIRDAIAAGARLSTHLGNGAHAMLPRHDNYIWEQLAADELWASLICDGHHLPPAVVLCMLRVKTPARIVLTCDASSLAGLPPGRYREWDQDIDVLPGGKVMVAGTSYLAGSGAFTDFCISNVTRMTRVPLAVAIDMAAVRPRALLGLPLPRLAAGAAADLVLFDWQHGGDVIVRATVVAGRIVDASSE
jgi:N-acetylglucosamine-6-phosphate deacetylase